MRNLLSANLLRLRKNNAFWGSIGVSLGMGLLMVVDSWRSAQESGGAWASTVDAELFKYAAFIGILAAELIPLFLGTEYSDGAIRNKLIAGHSRLSIYLSHLITSVVAALCAAGAYVLPVLALLVLGTLVLLAAYCALYTLVMMNCASRSRAAVICLLGMLVLYLAAGNIEIPLMHPEYMSMEVTDSGEIIPGEPNPRYVGGVKRQVLETLQDLLPTGQSLQYMRVDVAHPARLPLYSLIDVATFAAIGVALFRKKDLK